VFASVLPLFVAIAAVSCNRAPPEPTPPVHATAPSATADRALSYPPLAAQCPADVEGQASLPTGGVVLLDAPGRPQVDVELAVMPRDLERGLMYRRQMAEDHGMLFFLGERREHMFWMHNTCIALDMMFIDEDGSIVGIVENAEPLTDTARAVGKPSMFVLEVNGGYAQRHGVREGQRVRLPAAAHQP